MCLLFLSYGLGLFFSLLHRSAVSKVSAYARSQRDGEIPGGGWVLFTLHLHIEESFFILLEGSGGRSA
jgi:hypothetical protein